MIREYLHSRILNSADKEEAYWNRFKAKASSSFNCDQWKEQDIFFRQLSFRNCVAVLVWDVNQSTFAYAVDERGVLGHDISLYTKENGLEFSLSNFHPDYLDGHLLLQKYGIEYTIKFYTKNPGCNEHIILSVDSLYKRSSGSYFKLLQQAMIVEKDSNNQPMVFLSYIYDISHLKKVHTCNMVVKTPEGIELWNYDFEKKNTEKFHSFTCHEQKVLSLLSEGKHTKEIAHIFNSSPHTIDTHRRNLLRKTNCIDTTAMVSYCKIVGIL